MTTTLVELCDKLKEEDEVLLLEKLDITSEELVNRFNDVIEEKFDVLIIEYEEELDE